MLWLHFTFVGHCHFNHNIQKCTDNWLAAKRRFAAYNTNEDSDSQTEGTYFHSSHFFHCRDTQTDNVLMDRTHEAIISALQYMAATPMKKVYRVTFQCSDSVSRGLSSCLGNNLSVVAKAKEMFHGGVVGNYKRNQFNEFPPMEDCLSRWLEPNNKDKGFTYRGPTYYKATTCL